MPGKYVLRSLQPWLKRYSPHFSATHGIEINSFSAAFSHDEREMLPIFLPPTK
jgi:hypothetical protein